LISVTRAHVANSRLVRDAVVEPACSEWEVWIRRVLTPSNGGFGEIRCAAEYALLHMRRFSASAIAARASGPFVRIDALLPVLYLKGISTGDFQEALSAIMGPDAPNLSPGVISRLTAGWQAQYHTWTRRDLSARHYVYIWADGV
jgi:hypothetical protein